MSHYWEDLSPGEEHVFISLRMYTSIWPNLQEDAIHGFVSTSLFISSGLGRTIIQEILLLAFSSELCDVLRNTGIYKLYIYEKKFVFGCAELVNLQGNVAHNL